MCAYKYAFVLCVYVCMPICLYIHDMCLYIGIYACFSVSVCIHVLINVSVCTCVTVYMCICIGIHTYMSVYLYMHVHLFFHVHMHIYLCMCRLEYIGVNISVCMNVCIYVSVHVCMHVCMSMYMHMCGHICIHHVCLSRTFHLDSLAMTQSRMPFSSTLLMVFLILPRPSNRKCCFPRLIICCHPHEGST